jgi:hypothetical protein
MSRFEELRHAYLDARKDFFARRDASAAFAATIVEGMEHYLECPPFQVHFISNTREASATKAHNALGAVWLGTDSNWHFNIGLDLIDNEEGFRKDAARQTVVFELLVQPSDSGFNVGIKGWNDRFSLPGTDGTAERAAFYDFVFQHITGSYQQPGQRFFENGVDPQRAIG